VMAVTVSDGVDAALLSIGAGRFCPRRPNKPMKRSWAFRSGFSSKWALILEVRSGFVPSIDKLNHARTVDASEDLPNCW
jgi:hypothetical protein